MIFDLYTGLPHTFIYATAQLVPTFSCGCQIALVNPHITPLLFCTTHSSRIPRVGLDLINGTVRDNKKAGVLEPAVSKIKSLKFATEAAITILRIDDMIKLAPEKKDNDSYRQAMARGEL